MPPAPPVPEGSHWPCLARAASAGSAVRLRLLFALARRGIARRAAPDSNRRRARPASRRSDTPGVASSAEGEELADMITQANRSRSPPPNPAIEGTERRGYDHAGQPLSLLLPRPLPVP